MVDLAGKIAVVTGASRGVGRGVAIGLGEAGATVYVTGRTVAADTAGAATVAETACLVTAAGGRGIAIGCDHRDDAAVEALFQRVVRDSGHLDILVNNAWDGYRDMVEDGVFTWPYPFWRQPLWRWDAMFASGVRAQFTAGRLAAALMVERRSGLIANISFWAGQTYNGNAIYGVAKAATDRLAADMARDLREYGVAAVSIYPGLVRTELVMANAQHFDLSNSESPQYIGRAVAALAADRNVMDKTGQVLVAAALGDQYGFADIDGKHPRPLTLADFG